MAAEAHVRSLYRSVLRELPQIPRASKSRAPTSSPLRASIRKHFQNQNINLRSVPRDGATNTKWQLARRQEADQFVQYLKAQRMYTTLLDRYNPGMSIREEERVRLTARRVGMDMPVEWYGEKKKG